MKYFILLLLLCLIIFTSIADFNSPDKVDKKAKKYMQQSVIKTIKNTKITTKKRNFYAILVPAIQKTHNQLMNEYTSVVNDINSKKNSKKIQKLKKEYKVNNDKELLIALKPHPQSIVLAQAAMESAWGTSRFFNEANNVFGMWSVNKNEPRISAGEKRNGIRTIWLKKFTNIEDSIKAYYKLMATGKAYREFREIRFNTDDPFKIVKKLNRYSELGEKYTQEIASVIKYNKLTQYDK